MPDPLSPTAAVSARDVTIVAGDEQHDVEIDTERWAALAREVLVAEGRGGELTLTFVDTAEIAALNAEYMGKPGPTDVLSFPLDAAEAGDIDDLAMPGPVLLGDVVICPAIAGNAAPTHAGTLDDELALLVVHGVLHVLGHDHADPAETERMRTREREHLVAYHWHGPAPAAFKQEQS